MNLDIMSKLGEFNIDANRILTGDLAVLADLHKQYEELVSNVRKTVTATESQIESARNSAKQNEMLPDLVKAFKSEVFRAFYDAVDVDPEVSVLIFDALREISEVVKYERDYFLNSSKVASEPVLDMTDPVKFENAKVLGDLIRDLVGLFGTLGAKPEDFVGIDGFPAKISEKSGNVLISMSKLRDPNETSSAGRPVIGSKYRFKWNGEELPEKVTPNDVARNYISDPRNGYVVKWSEVVSMIKDAGKSPTRDDFKVKFPTGTLEGWIPAEDSE